MQFPGGVLPINEKDAEGRTALLLACYMGQLASVRALLDGSRDIDIDAGDRSGRTPLMWAATSKMGLPLVELLLERGASVTAQDDVNATALDWAWEKGNKDVIEVLAQVRGTLRGACYCQRRPISCLIGTGGGLHYPPSVRWFAPTTGLVLCAEACSRWSDVLATHS